MPISAERLLLDTSAAIALVSPHHVLHSAARQRMRGARLGLSGHATYETYSVLTRLPPPQRLSPSAARRLIETNFPDSVVLDEPSSREVLQRCVEADISGGAVYDALVASAARAHDIRLISADARAERTYRAWAIDYELLG